MSNMQASGYPRGGKGGSTFTEMRDLHLVFTIRGMLLFQSVGSGSGLRGGAFCVRDPEGGGGGKTRLYSGRCATLSTNCFILERWVDRRTKRWWQTHEVRCACDPE